MPAASILYRNNSTTRQEPNIDIIIIYKKTTRILSIPSAAAAEESGTFALSASRIPAWEDIIDVLGIPA